MRIYLMKKHCHLNCAASVKMIEPHMFHCPLYRLHQNVIMFDKTAYFKKNLLTRFDYCGIVYLTFLQSSVLRNATTFQQETEMADFKHKTHNQQHKIEGLKKHRVLNPHPHKVSDPLFRDPSCEFFDPHDLLQVKYEMLRSVEQEGCSVSEATRRFGFSRPCFYQARAAFADHGMAGLIRGHPGPKSARKLTDEVMEFIEQSVPEGEPLRSRVLAPKIQERFGIEVHPRSIERAVKRRKKKASFPARKQPGKNRRSAIGFGH